MGFMTWFLHKKKAVKKPAKTVSGLKPSYGTRNATESLRVALNGDSGQPVEERVNGFYTAEFVLQDLVRSGRINEWEFNTYNSYSPKERMYEELLRHHLISDYDIPGYLREIHDADRDEDDRYEHAYNSDSMEYTDSDTDDGYDDGGSSYGSTDDSNSEDDD